MPSWEDILDNPEQYLILNDELDILEMDDPAKLDSASVLRLTLHI